MLRSKKIIKLSICIIAVIFICAAAVFLLKAKIEIAAHKIYEKRSMLAVLEFKENNSLALSANYPIVRDNLPLLEKALPDKDNVAEAVNAIDVLAQETGNTQVLEFKPLTETVGFETIENVAFSAVLSGNIWSFREYLDKLKKLPYFVEITSVNISSDMGIFDPDGKMNIAAKLYIRK